MIRLSSRDEPKRKRRKRHSWTVDEARRFLESARRDDDVLYAAYVLVLVLGLRRGEVLGLTWERIDLDTGDLYVDEQLQRARHQLVRRQTKTDSSDAPLPLPELCVTALKLRRAQQDADVPGQARGGSIPGWSSPRSTAPRSSHATSTAASTAASARRAFPRSPCTAPGRPCGSLLATREVHPRVVMQILRHSKIALTMEIYTEVPSAATRAALKKRGRRLGA